MILVVIAEIIIESNVDITLCKSAFTTNNGEYSVVFFFLSDYLWRKRIANRVGRSEGL